MSTSMPVGQFEHQDLRVLQLRSGQRGAPVLFAAVVATTPARIATELINSWTITSEGGRHTGSALGPRRPGRTGSWLGPRLGFVEGLCDLGKGVGDGLVPVHVGTACAEFSRALLAESFRYDQADRPNVIGRLGHIALGRTLNDRCNLRLGGGKGARDQVEHEDHHAAITAPLEGENGTAAELKGGGRVV